MRASRVATALVVLAAGLTASALRRRIGDRRLPVPVGRVHRTSPVRPVVGAGAAVDAASAQAAPSAGPADRDAVVLAFAPRAVPTPAPESPAVPVRCGDDGGRTKAGAPCRTRATSGGRCHHHRRRDAAA